MQLLKKEKLNINIEITNISIVDDYVIQGGNFVVSVMISNPSNVSIIGVNLNGEYYDEFLPGSSNTYLFIKLNSSQYAGMTDITLETLYLSTSSTVIEKNIQELSE